MFPRRHMLLFTLAGGALLVAPGASSAGEPSKEAPVAPATPAAAAAPAAPATPASPATPAAPAAAKPLQAGEKAPDFDLTDTQGKTHGFALLRLEVDVPDDLAFERLI